MYFADMSSAGSRPGTAPGRKGGTAMGILEGIRNYFAGDLPGYLTALGQHIGISLLSLVLAAAIGVPLGILCARYKKQQRWVVGLFQVLRIVPSLAVLVLLIPVMGTGTRPAVTALVLLAIPPILMNTVAGIEAVPFFMEETAAGLGMTARQQWLQVKLPLAMPMILAGAKTAMVEIIASATLAAKIGAGGLGGIIFTGLGLNRVDLLLVGGVSVALLSITAGLLMSLLDRILVRYQYMGKKVHGMKKRKKAAAAALLLGLALLLAACGGGGKDAVRVGSKDFTENMIVSEVYALALEDAGYQVERMPGIAGSVIHAAITNNEIDLYPEYTGTGLLTILQMDMMTDPQAVYDTVKKEYEQQFSLTWLDYSSANDGQGLVIRADIATQLGIRTISDLQKNAGELRFASQGEFDERDDGLPALEATYGPFAWKSSRVYDNGLKYQVLSSGEADVAPAYTTEGQLADTANYTLLEDDKQVWPPYNLAPVVRNELLQAKPEVADVLNRVSACFDTATLTRLNAEVDVEKREVDAVAAEYYETIKAG